MYMGSDVRKRNAAQSEQIWPMNKATQEADVIISPQGIGFKI